MAETQDAGSEPEQAPIDWERAARTPELRELVERRRRFVVSAAGVALVWTFGFVLLASYAQDFMATVIVDGLTVAYVLGLSVFAMTWTLIWLYLRISRNELDPLERRAIDAARRTAQPAEPGSGTTTSREAAR